MVEKCENIPIELTKSKTHEYYRIFRNSRKELVELQTRAHVRNIKNRQHPILPINPQHLTLTPNNLFLTATNPNLASPNPPPDKSPSPAILNPTN